MIRIFDTIISSYGHFKVPFLTLLINFPDENLLPSQNCQKLSVKPYYVGEPNVGWRFYPTLNPTTVEDTGDIISQ